MAQAKSDGIDVYQWTNTYFNASGEAGSVLYAATTCKTECGALAHQTLASPNKLLAVMQEKALQLRAVAAHEETLHTAKALDNVVCAANLLAEGSDLVKALVSGADECKVFGSKYGKQGFFTKKNSKEVGRALAKIKELFSALNSRIEGLIQRIASLEKSIRDSDMSGRRSSSTSGGRRHERPLPGKASTTERLTDVTTPVSSSIGKTPRKSFNTALHERRTARSSTASSGSGQVVTPSFADSSSPLDNDDCTMTGVPNKYFGHPFAAVAQVWLPVLLPIVASLMKNIVGAKSLYVLVPDGSMLLAAGIILFVTAVGIMQKNPRIVDLAGKAGSPIVGMIAFRMPGILASHVTALVFLVSAVSYGSAQTYVASNRGVGPRVMFQQSFLSMGGILVGVVVGGKSAYLLALFGLVLAGSVGLVVWRLDVQKKQQEKFAQKLFSSIFRNARNPIEGFVMAVFAPIIIGIQLIMVVTVTAVMLSAAVTTILLIGGAVTALVAATGISAMSAKYFGIATISELFSECAELVMVMCVMAAIFLLYSEILQHRQEMVSTADSVIYVMYVAIVAALWVM